MTSTATPPREGLSRLPTWPWDLAGVAIVGALAGWTLVASAGRAGATPLPVLSLLGAGVVLFGIGRAAALRHADRVPALLAVGIAGAFLLTFPGVLSSGGEPTGYANTNGTLAGLGLAASVAVASSSRGPQRRGWILVASLLGACLAMSESTAAAGAMLVAAVLGAVAVLRREASVACLGGLLATWVTLAITAAFADRADTSIAGEQGLRVELWGRALDLAREAPLRGHGPGSFAPPFALWDHDLRWAHHEYLQQASEAGLVGLVLLLVLVAWLYAYLWWGRRRGLARSVAGASAVTLVALHATVDHVLHTAAVPLTLAVLVGWATADPRRRGSRGSPHPPR